MMGNDIPVMIHGHVLSSLFARAISRAPALQGLAKRLAGSGWAGFPGWAEDSWESETGCRSEGDRVGEEKDKRYSPMKKASLAVQQMNRTS
jgi:hypothetical protein